MTCDECSSYATWVAYRSGRRIAQFCDQHIGRFEEYAEERRGIRIERS